MPLRREVAGRVDEEPRGPVGGRVEGNLEFDAAARAQEMHALVGNQLRAAGEDGVAGGKVEQRRGQPVGAELRIAIESGDDARRLLAEGVARGLDAVAADVVERAAAGFDLVADVGGVDVEVAEDAR